MIAKLFRISIMGLLLLIITALPTLNTATEKGDHRDLSDMLKQVTSAVVNITVEKGLSHSMIERLSPKDGQQNHPPKQQALVALGSGVILDALKGLIVTNAHVIKNARLIIVTLKDGRRFHGKLIGEDEGFDIAVIQIHAKALKAISLANSNAIKVGSPVVAIGSPFGLRQTVTAGIISALNRSHPRIEGYQNFIQTDAPINPGNSGGALVNTKGELIGINTAIVAPVASNTGIGFAIPSNMIAGVAAQLIRYGKVKRGVLGILGQNITPDLADALQLKKHFGILVTQVRSDTPAEKAGLKVEDVILSVDGVEIHRAAQLHNMFGILRPGTHVKIIILRKHRRKSLSAIVGDPKDLALKQSKTIFLSGMRLQKFMDMEPNGSLLTGIMVTYISDNSNAILAGLQLGDIIISANHHLLTSLKQFIRIAKNNPKQLLLKVVRDNRQLFLVLQK